MPQASRFRDIPLAAPLVLDLERCMIAGDLLLENFAAAFRNNILIIFSCLYWLIVGGRAHLKARLAHIAPLDADLLPANRDLVELAVHERRAGRPIVLATAADELLAKDVKRRFTFLSRVIAFDGIHDFDGPRKTDLLLAEYPLGFIYAGNSSADISAWNHAEGVVTVGASAEIRRKARSLGKPTIDIDGPVIALQGLVKSVRPQEWAKNALVLVPVAVAFTSSDGGAWLNAGLAFLAISFLVCATYTVNDLSELVAYRKQHAKRQVPTASQQMSTSAALLLFRVSLGLTAAIGAYLGPASFFVLALYGTTTLLYSSRLKGLPIVDVVTLTGLLAARLLLGVTAIGAALPPQLLVFAMAFFFSLSLAERHVEVVHGRAGSPERSVVHGYDIRDESFLLVLGIGSALSSVALLALYLCADVFQASHNGASMFLWFGPAIILLWLSRIWLLAHRGELDDDPITFALGDRQSHVLAALLGVAVLAAAL